jgi:NADH-quinone oxidoreductase subunit G
MPTAKIRFTGLKVARGTPSATGRTAMFAHVNVHEGRPPQDEDTPFSHTMEGFGGQRPSALTSFYWKPGWNSVQSLAQYQQEPGGQWKNDDHNAQMNVFHRAQKQSSSTYQPQHSSLQKRDSLKNSDKKRVILPLYHLFGSDHLGHSADELRKRFPSPYVALGKKDYHALASTQKSQCQFSFEFLGRTIKLPVQLKEHLPDGYIGLPVGLPDFFWFSANDEVSIL